MQLFHVQHRNGGVARCFTCNIDFLAHTRTRRIFLAPRNRKVHSERAEVLEATLPRHRHSGNVFNDNVLVRSTDVACHRHS